MKKYFISPLEDFDFHPHFDFASSMPEIESQTEPGTPLYIANEPTFESFQVNELTSEIRTPSILGDFKVISSKLENYSNDKIGRSKIKIKFILVFNKTKYIWSTSRTIDDFHFLNKSIGKHLKRCKKTDEYIFGNVSSPKVPKHLNMTNFKKFLEKVFFILNRLIDLSKGKNTYYAFKESLYGFLGIQKGPLFYLVNSQKLSVKNFHVFDGVKSKKSKLIHTLLNEQNKLFKIQKKILGRELESCNYSLTQCFLDRGMHECKNTKSSKKKYHLMNDSLKKVQEKLKDLQKIRIDRGDCFVVVYRQKFYVMVISKYKKIYLFDFDTIQKLVSKNKIQNYQKQEVELMEKKVPFSFFEAYYNKFFVEEEKKKAQGKEKEKKKEEERFKKQLMKPNNIPPNSPKIRKLKRSSSLNHTRMKKKKSLINIKIKKDRRKLFSFFLFDIKRIWKVDKEFRGSCYEPFDIYLSPSQFYKYTILSRERDEIVTMIEEMRKDFTRRKKCVINDIKKLWILKETKYDSNNEEHEKLLKKLFNTTFPEVKYERKSPNWVKLGFQGEDPSSDFRSMGILGLHQVLYFSEKYTYSMRRILVKNREYPFCVAGINVGSLLLCGILGLNMSNLTNHEKWNQEALNFLTLMSYSLQENENHVFEEMACLLLKKVDKIYEDEECTYMQFSIVLERVKSQFKKVIKNREVDNFKNLEYNLGVYDDYEEKQRNIHKLRKENI